MIKYNEVTSFKILDNCNLAIKFDNKDTYLYKNVTDLSVNKHKGEIDCFVIVDKFERIIGMDDFSLINKIFGITYDEAFFASNIKGNMNFLQIEGSVTIYAIYEDKISI